MAKKERIALITQYYPPETGAASNRMHFFTEELQRYFEQVDVFTAQPNYPNPSLYLKPGKKKGWWESEKCLNVAVFRCRIFPANTRGFVFRALNFLSLPLMLFGWMGRLWRHDTFIITSGPMFTGFPIFLLSYFKRVTIILDVRDLWPERLWETGASNPPHVIKRILKLYESWMYSRCAAVITVTQALLEKLDLIIDDDTNLYLVRNCDQTASVENKGNNELTSEGGRLVVVESGTQGIAQNPELLCQVIVTLAEKYPGKIELYIAGSGTKVQVIQEFASRYSCISYVGNLFVDKLDEFLAQADVGVAVLSNTKHNEMAVSRRMFDYAKNGLAIVLSGAGEGASVLRETGAGEVVVPENSVELEAVLESFLIDNNKLRLYKKNSRNLLSEKFGKQHAARELGRCVAETLEIKSY